MIVFTSGKDAFRQAFTDYTDTVYKIAIHNTDCEADAQDITQEAFLRLYESEKIFRGEEHIKAWLIRVTINLCHDRHRESKRIEVMNQPVCDETVYDINSVLDAIKALPENYRNAIYLNYYEGYTAKEIGKILDVKQNTVLTWLKRGREALKKDLIGGFDDE